MRIYIMLSIYIYKKLEFGGSMKHMQCNDGFKNIYDEIKKEEKKQNTSGCVCGKRKENKQMKFDNQKRSSWLSINDL